MKTLLYKTKFFLTNAWISIPYSWLILFFLIPFLFLLAISFAEPFSGIPPYTSILRWWSEGVLSIRLSFSNYAFIFLDSLYAAAYVNSIFMAFFATMGCLIIGYPIAYTIVTFEKRWKPLLLMLVILPFWISFLIRVYAWMILLNPHGLVNSLLLYFNIIQEPIEMIGTSFAVWIGVVYSYIPFMILPLYASLEKMDFSHLEAAYDLGCKPFKVFWKVVVPLSSPGAFSGAILVFIPAVGEFVIPELLGGSKALMIGKLLWNDFFFNRDWPVAAALAVLMLIVLIAPMLLLQYVQKKVAS